MDIKLASYAYVLIATDNIAMGIGYREAKLIWCSRHVL